MCLVVRTMCNHTPGRSDLGAPTWELQPGSSDLGAAVSAATTTLWASFKQLQPYLDGLSVTRRRTNKPSSTQEPTKRAIQQIVEGEKTVARSSAMQTIQEETTADRYRRSSHATHSQTKARSSKTTHTHTHTHTHTGIRGDRLSVILLGSNVIQACSWNRGARATATPTEQRILG